MMRVLVPRIALAMFVAFTATAQEEIGQVPPGLDWRQLETERFRVIFPQSLESEAQRVANLLEHVYKPVSNTLQGPLEQLDVVLTNQTAESNGYVALAPRRSQWFSVPPQGTQLASEEWYVLLAIHEMRHVVQFDRMKRGAIRFAHWLGGDNGHSLVQLTVPAWFWEGDAVGTETALSRGGRGRAPDFDLPIRALLLDGRRYSYHKASLRSFKDWYPSHYPLGYLMTTYVKRAHGPDAWRQVLDRSSRWAFNPYAFSRALKKHTGATVSETYNKTMDELTELWREQQEALVLTPAHPVEGARPGDAWTNYEYPQPVEDGILTSKHGIADAPSLVLLDEEGETRLRFYAPMGGVKVGGSLVAWNRYAPDLRWTQRSYSDVVLLDLRHGDTRQITDKGKYYAPAPSPDGMQVAAVELSEDRSCRLVLLDADNGERLAVFEAPPGAFWRSPAWSTDGASIAFVHQDDRGNAVHHLDLASGDTTELTVPTWDAVGWPVFWRGYVLYNSPRSGIDNIWAVRLQGKAAYQVTSRALAARNAAVRGDTLYFQDYTADGNRVMTTLLDPASWRPEASTPRRDVAYYTPLLAQEGGTVIGEGRVPTKVYESHPYSPQRHLLNVHSWTISPLAPDYSLSLVSTDLLGVSQLETGVEYNSNEQTFSALGDLSLAVRYPILDLGGRWGERAGTYKDGGRTIDDSWEEKSLRTGLRVPLNLTRGPWNATVSAAASIAWTRIDGKQFAPRVNAEGIHARNAEGSFLPVAATLEVIRHRQRAERDLAPSWGQSVRLAYSDTPFGGDYGGRLLSGRVDLNVPGLFRSHSTWVHAAYEHQRPDTEDRRPYRFASRVPFARGYDYTFHRRYRHFGVTYGVPLAYPDRNLMATLQVKRLQLHGFADIAHGGTSDYRSAGLETVADVAPFSWPLPLQVGVRYSHRLDGSGGQRWDALVTLAQI